MREDYNDSLRVFSFEEMHRYAHEEGVSSADKMALIMTTDMGFNHCFRDDTERQYVIGNSMNIAPQRSTHLIMRLR